MNGFFISSQGPYGYKKDPNNHNKLIIDYEAAQVVKYIFDMVLKKMGTVTICNRLMNEGIPTPGEYKTINGDTRFNRFLRQIEGKEKGVWRTVTVNKILKDIVYIGDIENRKYEVENYKTKIRVRVPIEEHIIVKNTNQAIITREDFDEVQEIMKSRILQKNII